LLKSVLVRASLLAGIVMLCLAPLAVAQVSTGTLVGSVIDASGQPVALAEVRASDPQHGIERTAATDASGAYRLADLPPASYAVQVSAAGFRAASRSAVAVAVATSIRVDFKLPLAAAGQTVEVAGAVRLLQTDSGDLGTVFDRDRIESLPLNRRDFLQLALLTPGVQGPVDGSELSSRGGVAIHVNGAREEFNNFLLDGADNNDAYVNRYVVQPSVDSIEEFKVATNSYSAEYGRNAGGQVNVITRRGTNRFSGSANEYFRDRSLNASNYFESDKQPFGRNQFGGALGGPLVVDRTFVFGTIDVLREHETLSRLGSVPSAAARGGNLVGLAPVVDPFTGAPFAGNVIPASRISALARQVIGLFPSANRSDASANYLGQPVQSDDDTQFNVRIDHRISGADRLMARVSMGRVDLFEPYTEGTGVTAGYGDFVNDRTWNAMAQHEHVFAHAVNAVRVSVNRLSRDLLTENYQTNAGAAWGVNWLNVPAQSFGYPSINVAGYSRVGDAFSLPILRDATTYQVAEDLSIDRGRHLAKIGGDLRYLRLNSQLDLFSRGQLNFTGAFTGSGIGDLLLGLPTFGLQAKSNNPIAMRTNTVAAYLQDDWRVLPSLTVNLGVRYEYVTPPVDARDGMSTLNFQTGKIVQVGTDGVSRSGMQPDRNNLAPRINASWRAGDATVVRGGYGVYYDSGMLTVNTAQYFNPPQFNLSVFVPSAQGLLTLDNPFPATAGFAPPATLSVLSPDLQTGYMQHWNAAVERHIDGVGTATIAYAGSKGSNLIHPININQAAPGAADVQGRRPYPSYSDIFLVQSDGRSRYDSLQLSFNRPLARHVSVLASYTLSESNDLNSTFLGTPADTNLPQNSRNPEAEWGPSSFDVRHRFTLAYLITLPQGNVLTRNVQIQGITTVHSGQPFTPILRFDNSNSGNTGGSTAGVDRPNLVGDPELSNPGPGAWFNTKAFAIAAPYSFGNAGRNSVRGPGFASFDLGVSRRFDAGGARAITIGLQVFNLFNRTNFDLPEHFADEPTTFGRVFSAKAPRQVQLTARVVF
jgi:outer membrane receptor protein involved in Fe transport